MKSSPFQPVMARLLAVMEARAPMSGLSSRKYTARR